MPCEPDSKRALILETNAAMRLDSHRIPRFEWTEMYICRRERAPNTSNVLARWRGAGLMALSSVTVLGKVPLPQQPEGNKRHTPPELRDLDASLLEGFPPDGTELREASAVFNSAVEASQDLPSSAKRFSEGLTRSFETTHAENTALRKQLEEAQQLLNAPEARMNDKRVALKGKFVFSTEEVLEVARQAEAALSAKKPRGRPPKRPIAAVIEEEDDQILEESDKASEHDCIVVAARR